MNQENDNCKKEFKYLRPFVVWIFRFFPLFALSLTLTAFLQSVEKSFNKQQVAAFEKNLNWWGEAGFQFFIHSITWSVYALYFLFFVVSTSFLLQAFTKKSGKAWEQFALGKHIVFDHMGEFMTMFAGALTSIILQEINFAKFDALTFGNVFVLACVVASSYAYVWVLHNEKPIQDRVNHSAKNVFARLSELFARLSSKIP